MVRTISELRNYHSPDDAASKAHANTTCYPGQTRIRVQDTKRYLFTSSHNIYVHFVMARPFESLNGFTCPKILKIYLSVLK